jgi:hypothetical protein
MTKGFGSPLRYKLVIVTAVGGATDLILAAASRKIAVRQSTTILNVLANPDVDVYLKRAEDLGFGDSIEALQTIGQQMIGASVELSVHPQFAAKIANRAALTKKGDRSVFNPTRAEAVRKQIQSKHFLATLYAPNGQGIQQYSNLMELGEFDDWGKVG